jgi:hypothetical protein
MFYENNMCNYLNNIYLFFNFKKIVMKKVLLKRITVIVISSFCLFYVTGQTIEDQLLSQLHSTNSTELSDVNKWTKIAECEIKRQYDDIGGIIDFMGSGSTYTQMYYGRIVARFKNQSASAAPPNVWNLILMDSNLGAENVKALIKSDRKVEIYVKIPCTYTTFYFRQILKSNSGPLTTFSKQPFLTSITGGTVINCEEGNNLAGSVNDFVFNSASPVYGANIVYNATFSNANQLRNIIALRNHNTNGAATTLRQSGISFSLSHEVNITESSKSAQILLESSNNYANYPALNFYTNNTKRLSILHDGSVGIGTASTFGYKLAVNGTIGAKEVVAEISSRWPDFVFEEDYVLTDLSEVEQFVNENKHLPGIPSANELEETGVNLGNMQGKLLQKIEELTLYIIEQQKSIEKLTSRIDVLEKELENK